MFCHKCNVLDLLKMHVLILKYRSEWATLQIVFLHSIELYWKPKPNQNTTHLSPLLFKYLKLTGLIWSAELYSVCEHAAVSHIGHFWSDILSRSQTYRRWDLSNISILSFRPQSPVKMGASAEESFNRDLNIPSNYPLFWPRHQSLQF